MTNFFLILIITILLPGQISIPIGSSNRQDTSKIHLTKIGHFGLVRKARTNVPEHYHTGIDIKRPNDNYESEPIFPIAKGIVISKRTDGPFANLIIEHEINGIKLWTLYEHIAGVKVNVTDIVNSKTPIARFMNKKELDRFGWQFDHFHFELIKVKPSKIKPSNKNPERFYNSYSLTCYCINDLNKYYFDPIEYFNYNINK
ncbi:MAG: M23 family metallopeptidase [Bacteroidetes bacterium]|nr:M23 family metallopeptidase [Bacteroidota bacterium]